MSVSAVVYLSECAATPAAVLAKRFAIPLIDGVSLAGGKAKELKAFLAESLTLEAGLVFLLDADGLRLHAAGDLNCSIRADFHGPTVTYRRKQGGGRGQMIAKAVGLKAGHRPSVLDCTAGLGGDAFVLASLGCRVTLLERAPVVVALLEDGLAQARIFAESKEPALSEILERMTLVQSDALDYLKEANCARPDVIYLDPMFPVRSKSAQVKKEMQVFHHLVGQDLDADALLEAALPLARSRVVVKRPRVAPDLKGPKPSHVLEGKSNRYDVYTAALS